MVKVEFQCGTDNYSLVIRTNSHAPIITVLWEYDLHAGQVTFSIVLGILEHWLCYCIADHMLIFITIIAISSITPYHACTKCPPHADIAKRCKRAYSYTHSDAEGILAHASWSRIRMQRTNADCTIHAGYKIMHVIELDFASCIFCCFKFLL